MPAEFIRAMHIHVNRHTGEETASGIHGAVRFSEIVAISRWYDRYRPTTTPVKLTMRDGTMWSWRPSLASWPEARAILSLTDGECPIHPELEPDEVGVGTCILCHPTQGWSRGGARRETPPPSQP